MMEKQTVSPLARELMMRGHSVLEDVDDPSTIAIASLKLVPFLKENEKEISGPELRQRAKALKANFGQKFSDLVYSKQKEISADWRPYRLVFPGTLWLGENDDRGFPELYWQDGWHANYHWIGFNLDDRYRLINLV